MEYNKEDNILETSYEYYKNGNIRHVEYSKNCKRHREDGPAEIYYYENGNIHSEHYRINDTLHRENGPALIQYYQNGDINYEYFLHGARVNLNKYTDINYENIINLINNCKSTFSLLKIKLLINIKIEENKKELLDLIDAKSVMLKLI